MTITHHQNSNQLVKTCDIHISVALNKKDTDIKDGHDEVRNDSYIISFPFFGFCGCPVESIQGVLTKGREKAVSHLAEE